MIAPRRSDDSAKCVVGHDVHEKILVHYPFGSHERPVSILLSSLRRIRA
jgi:hypothetical protein